MELLLQPRHTVRTCAQNASLVVGAIAGRSLHRKHVQCATWPGYIQDFFDLNDRIKKEDNTKMYERVSRLSYAQASLNAMELLLGTGGNFIGLRQLFNAWHRTCKEIVGWDGSSVAVWDMFSYSLFHSYDTGAFTTENVVKYTGVDVSDNVLHSNMQYGVKLSCAPETDSFAGDEIDAVESREFALARTQLAGSGVELAGMCIAAVIRDVPAYKRLCVELGLDDHMPADTEGDDFQRVVRVFPWHEGKTMRDMLDDETTLSTSLATRYLELLHTTLTAFIQTGLHHADINGGNILWRPDGCTVLDFGIAGHTGHRHTTGVIYDRIQDYRQYAKEVYAEHRATFSRICGENSHTLPTWKQMSRLQDKCAHAPSAPANKRVKTTRTRR